MFAFMDRRTMYQVRPFLEQYGLLILLAILFFPFGNSIGSRIISPILNGLFEPPGGRLGPASSGRTCGPVWRLRSARHWRPGHRPVSAHCSIRCMSPTAATGSTSSRSLRADGATDPDVLIAGLIHDAGKGNTGVGPRVAFTLGERYGTWVWDVTAFLPGWRAALARLRTHAETSAALAAAAGCSTRTIELIRHQDAPTDPDYGEMLRLADEAN